MADLLLKAGAKPSFFTDAASGKIDALRPRLEADPTIARRPDGWGRAPLAYAAAAGQIEAARLLISYGAKDEPADGGERLALYWAIRAKQVPMVKLLLDNGSNANAIGEYQPFVHTAAASP